MGAFDDLLPEAPVAGAFDDLIVNDTDSTDQVSRAASRVSSTPAWSDTGDQVSRTKAAREDSRGFDPALLPEQFKSGVAGMQQGWYADQSISTQKALQLFDRIDRGESVPEMEDPYGYQHMDPKTRAETRASVSAISAKDISKFAEYSKEQAGYRKNPNADALTQQVNDGSYAEAWKTFASDPVGIMQQLGVQSSPNSIPSLVGGVAGAAVKGNRIAGLMLGMASGSYPVEYMASLVDSLGEAGVNLSDPKAVEKKLQDPEFLKAAEHQANMRGTVIASVDALGGKAVPGLKAGAKQIGKNIGRAAVAGGMETGLEMGGELGAQVASGQDIKLGDVLAEGLGAGPQAGATLAGKTIAEIGMARDAAAPAASAAPAAPAGTFDDLIPASTGPVADMAAAVGIDPLTLKPIAPQDPEQAAPAALPPPSQVAVPMGEALPVTEIPNQTPGEAHAAGVYAAREAEDARKQALTASKIEIDPADPAGSIKAIAEAPLTPVAPALSAPTGVDEKAHATASGDLAASFLQISDLQRQVKVTPKPERAALEARIKAEQDQTRATIAQYKAQYGEDAGSHMHRVAAETFHTMKRDYQSLQKPAASVQKPAGSTEREQPAAVNTAPTATPTGDRGQRSLTPPQTSVPQRVQPANIPETGSTVPSQGSSGPDGRVVVTKALARINELKAKTKALIERTGGDLTGPEAEEFKAATDEIQSLRYDRGRPDTADDVKASPEERLSTITPDTHAVISSDLWRSKHIYTAINSAAAGAHFASNTAVDDVFDGKNKDVTPQQMYDNFAGSRAALEKQYGPVLTLYRAEGKQKQKTTTNWATTREFAAQFGDNIVSKQVPVADVLAAHSSGKGRYHELIVGDSKALLAKTKASTASKDALTVDDLAYTIKDGKVVPPAKRKHGIPFDLAAKTKRSANKLAVVADIGKQAALVLARPSSTVMRHPTKPRILNPYERGVVVGLIRDAKAAGVPEASWRVLTSFHVYTPESKNENAHHVIYQDGERTIGFAEGVLDAIRDGDPKWTNAALSLILHELGHAIDSKPGHNGATYASAESPLFEISMDTASGFRTAQGDVIREMLDAFTNDSTDADLKQFLQYPLDVFFDDHAKHGLSEKQFRILIKQEAFGQLHTLYYNHPELMKRELPKSFALIKEIHNAIAAIEPGSTAHTISEVENVVRQTLRTPGSNEPVQYPGVDGYSVDRGGDVSRDTSEGMGGIGDEGGGPAEVGRGKRSVNNRRLKPGEADLNKVLDALTLEERQKLKNAKNAKKFVAIFKEMPASKETAAIAWAGRAKRGWYRKSALALHHVFGPDAPRFAALLAAMSPQTGVEANLHNALNTWVNWVNEGRPQSHSAIMQIMGRSVMGNKLTDSVLDAWVNNSLRSLTHPFPGELIISGPKVDSFMRNLVGVVQEVTNDSWMAAYSGVAQEIFGGTTSNPLDKPVKQPGKGAGYLAMSAHVRQAAAMLTKLTGETWTPAEVQETVWSWSKALYESASQDHSARAIIENKELTDAVINATPDFGSLLEEGTYADILKRSAEGAAGVQRLAEANRETAQSETAASLAGSAGQTAPFAEGTQRRLEVEAAKRLDARRAGVEPKFLPKKKGPQPGDATMSDFRADAEAALQKPGWAIVTATRDSASEMENAVANDNLESYLTKQKIEWHEVKGSYKGVDQGRSYIIFAQEEKAEQIGRKYKQESILDHRGLVYMNGAIDPAVPESTLVGSGATDSDFYSTLPDGTSFAMGLESQQGTTARDITSDRESVVESTELRGDGRGFTDFFSAASRGERAPDVKTYKPVLDIKSISDFSAEYVKHRGNFDDHIATSIPGFREVQQAVGAAIVETYQDKPVDVHLLDIAASEGAFNKAISAQSGGTIVTLALDPNLTMAKFFKTHSTVKGAEYEVAAFGSAEDAGQEAWTEDDGTVIKTFDPDRQYDVIHESMGFQFISNSRNAQFARVKEMLKPDGIALFEEKIKEDTPQWRRNEAQKDGYKARYFTAQQMKAKAAEVLEKGAASAADAESQREQAVVGMNDLMTTGHEFETALKNNFTHVVQYWDSGNFKGYVGSDSRAALDKFLGNLINLNSEFSTVATPVTVSVAKAGNVFVTAIEAETGREVRVEMPAQDALDNIDADVEKLTRLKLCLSS